MTRKVMELDSEWIEIIETQLKWVERWIFRMLPDLGKMYSKGPRGRIKLIQLIIDSGLITKSDIIKVRCLGTYFGQAIVETTGWPWKVVEDKYGIDIAIQVPKRKDCIFPIPMIVSRIENNEHICVQELFDGVVLQISSAE